MHYSVRLRCSACQANIRYDDERPDWRELEIDPALLDAARQFVREHPRASVFLNLPPHVRLRNLSLALSGDTYVDEVYRYVVCPACGGQAYPVDGDGEGEDSGV